MPGAGPTSREQDEMDAAEDRRHDERVQREVDADDTIEEIGNRMIEHLDRAIDALKKIKAMWQ